MMTRSSSVHLSRSPPAIEFPPICLSDIMACPKLEPGRPGDAFEQDGLTVTKVPSMTNSTPILTALFAPYPIEDFFRTHWPDSRFGRTWQ